MTACGGGSDDGTVNTPPVNKAPTAIAQDVLVTKNNAIVITLAGNDTDGNITSFTIGSEPSNGILSGTGTTQTYTPNADFNGSDTFQFSVTDNDGAVSSLVTVDITVNSLPVADHIELSVNEDNPIVVTLTGSDVDGSIAQYQVTAQPSHGALNGSGAEYTYVPNAHFYGSDTLQFKVTDNHGGVSELANVTIDVNSVNDDPVFSSTLNAEVSENITGAAYIAQATDT